MTVTVEIPDAVASSIVPEGTDGARKLLEDTVAQAYRDGKIATKGLREALGLEWFEVDPFLLKYEIFDYTVEDYRQDLETLKKIDELRAAELVAR